MRMRKGFTVFSPSSDVDLVPRAIALALESLMKCRRLILFIFWQLRTQLYRCQAMNNMTRRDATKLIGAAAAGFLLPIDSTRAESSLMLTRAIPSSGEK